MELAQIKQEISTQQHAVTMGQTEESQQRLSPNFLNQPLMMIDSSIQHSGSKQPKNNRFYGGSTLSENHYQLNSSAQNVMHISEPSDNNFPQDVQLQEFRKYEAKLQ